MLITVLQQTSVDSCYFVSSIYRKLLSLICWGSGLFRLDLHLGRQMELPCIYMRFTVKKIYTFIPTPATSTPVLHSDTHKHKIHQRHLLWFFCVQAPDRGVGGCHYYTADARCLLQLYFIMETLLAAGLSRNSYKHTKQMYCLFQYLATSSLHSPAASVPCCGVLSSSTDIFLHSPFLYHLAHLNVICSSSNCSMYLLSVHSRHL